MDKIIIFVIMLLCGATNLLQAQTNDINSLRQRAMSGDADAMYQLALAYDQKGDKELSALWYKKAIESGSKGAINNKKNEDLENLRKSEPREYFRQIYKLAGSGDAKAMTLLGNLYDVGSVVAQDTEEALSWYRKALAISETTVFNKLVLSGAASFQIAEEYAQKGNERAIMALGDYYYSVCDEKSGIWWNGEMYLDKDSGKKAMEYYKIASKAGNVEARKRYDDLIDVFKRFDNEQERVARKNKTDKDLKKATMRHFAGTWRCSVRNTSQFKFDGNGNGWYRSGPGYKWHSLVIMNIGYGKLEVSDGGKNYVLEYNSLDNTFTMGSLVYRRF